MKQLTSLRMITQTVLFSLYSIHCTSMEPRTNSMYLWGVEVKHGDTFTYLNDI